MKSGRLLFITSFFFRSRNLVIGLPFFSIVLMYFVPLKGQMLYHLAVILDIYIYIMELDAYTQLNCKLPTARDIYTCIYSKSFSIFNIYVYMCVCVTNTHKKLVNFCIYLL